MSAAFEDFGSKFELPGNDRRFASVTDSWGPLNGGRRITDQYTFSLEHELIDPETTRGYVESVSEPEAIGFNGRVVGTVQDIMVVDPYVAADSRTCDRVTYYIENVVEARMQAEGFDIRANRLNEKEPGARNRYTQAWLGDTAVRSLAAWHGLVPTALALDYLTKPMVGRDINGEMATPQTVAQLRFVADAIGVRDREVAMAWIVGRHMKTMPGSGTAETLSLACGTALPAINAAIEVQKATGRRMNLTLADIDQAALDRVAENAAEAGFTGGLNKLKPVNILRKDLAEYLDRVTGRKLYDMVEETGFLEYMPDAGDEMQAYRKKGLPPASEFLRKSFELVAPGGISVSGNMVLPRRQLAFVFGTVDWPIINARSEKQILTIYERAGLLPDVSDPAPQTKFEMFRVIDKITGLHIYNLMVNQKLV